MEQANFQVPLLNDAELATLLPERRELFALFLHQPALALRPLGSYLPDPEAQRRCGQVQLTGDAPDGLAFIQDKPNRPFLFSSENCRRGRWPRPAFDMRSIIVSTFRKMSTKQDQAHQHHCPRIIGAIT